MTHRAEFKSVRTARLPGRRLSCLPAAAPGAVKAEAAYEKGVIQMGLFSSKSVKKVSAPPFDPAAEEPAIRCSICTGEQVAGFRNRSSGHFREVTLIQTPKDLERFKKDYGVEELKKIF